MSGHPIAVAMGRLVPSTRYRHPGDVIRLIAGSILLLVSLVASKAAARWLLGPDASAGGIGFGPASDVLTGIVQVACVAAAALVVAATLWHRRFRLLLGLAAGAAVASGVAAAILLLLGARHPAALTDNLGHGSWLVSVAFPGPALIAGAVALIVAASPWLSRPWRRTAWLTLLLVVVVRLVTGTVLPMELLLAFATGLTVGAAVLVAFGVPDRRIGPGEIAQALRAAGLPAESVRPANVVSKGSRPFDASGADGQRWFIKALGSDQRDADLLYRAYRAVRLRNVGDTRPAATLFQAVEHQALVGVMAERAGVVVPSVDRVVKVGHTALLVLGWVDGGSLEQFPAEQITDDLLAWLWADVDKQHKAGIAHRSLHAGNVLVEPAGRPVIADFSFSELAATRRQMDLDVAELLASLATLVGEDRAVSAAVKVVGAEGTTGLAAAVPLLQPLALSAGTRRAVKQQDGLLTRTRSAAAAASGLENPEPVRLQRVRPRHLLTIAALAGVYYILLPQLAKVGNPLAALESAQWAWVLAAIGFSALTYLASAIGLLGGVSVRVPFWPTLLTQGASSYVNRVSPANVGGMALNARFLQKAGVEPIAGVAAVGVNSLAGALVHAVLLVIFFAWAGRGGASKAFHLPSSSVLLAVLSVVVSVIGIVIATRQGRNFAARKVLPPLRSSLASLGKVARSPVRLTMLFGGSAVVTLANVGALVASVEAFGGGASIAKIGAVYMVASVVATATPTPGGVGGYETAAIAGLTGIGISSAAAVSAVVISRLATYWLPVLPGWACWRALQRLGYV
jgi:undecaprenyl-diphosphatase